MCTNDNEPIDELEKIEIELLLEALYRHYGVDFRNYVFPTIRRRIWYRIRAERLKTISGLQEKVLHDRNTFKRLTNDFSINVTEMFRDPSFFQAFRNKVVPLLREYPSIRIWHAGCSTGEEAYSMAILMHEEKLLAKTRIYATDMNEAVIEEAKLESFPAERMQQYTENYMLAGGKKSMTEYVSVSNGRAEFQPFLGGKITFAQHNLAVDESFNEFHVIICRNAMIYFNTHLQNRVHELFYQSLIPSGFLGLGHKESITFTSFADCYKEMEHNEKLYRKVK
ncbi:chemotaxis protein CheR [Paenibacillus pectinilyticus]|uniref:Chemotaxis protein CheR n=1 Tax=Paenibacillus pectinilyticus TaxID=512399 RepID=A0A1C1A496_9BACL|nr:protein-glutamate O-methyltransferase CheR [Paenibacillus pectinilyticus]OCT15387.1 chemotaxis protein CheR [Paenibacillus pectinilyticus]